MTSTIEKLLIIQDHDLRILKCEKELADLPQRKKAIDSRLDEHRHAIVAAKEVLKTRQAGIKKCELEIESFRERIRKYREQQMQLKNNQEFRAMENEISGVEQQIRGVEDKILEMMDSVEAAQGDVKTKEEALKAEESGLKSEFEAIDRRGVELKADLARLQQERTTYAVDVDKARLSQYERFFKNKKDKVLVAVEDNGTCGGCHMKLPPYICHDAKKQLDVVACGYCGRMLY